MQRKLLYGKTAPSLFLHIIIMIINIGQLKTYFSQGDSLFITIFASLFSVLGILLNLLVLVAVLNYRVTRRHVSSPSMDAMPAQC